jgi:hypothetical protein
VIEQPATRAYRNPGPELLAGEVSIRALIARYSTNDKN